MAASIFFTASMVRSRPGSAQMTPASAALKQNLEALLLGDLLEDRQELLLELALQLLLQLVDFRLRVLLESLAVDLLLLDVFLELRARGIAQKRAALLQFLPDWPQAPWPCRRLPSASSK